MRDLYEILGIDTDADDARIRSAYRVAALRWHPDKNQDNLTEAEERFKEIQNAYEVLSDKHERAWYDSHKHDILRHGSRHQAGGAESFTPGQAPEDEINLFPYFSSTCFNGYKDGAAGFYGVYEELFFKLARQEQEAVREQDEDDNSAPPQPPPFGTSQTEWSLVSTFYNHWLNFATCKDFAWADQYNPASAPNRKVRRLMEEENRKARKAKRREFNDTVRELAAFVRKRDKRVAAYQAEEAQKRLAKEAEDQKRREEERKERLQRAREFEEAAWAQADAEADSDEEPEEPEALPDELYCLACDKTFRTENALANHQKSKKHLERLEILREVLQQEEGTGEDSTQGLAAGDSNPSSTQLEPWEPSSEGQPEALSGSRKKSKKQRKRAAQLQPQPSSPSGDSGLEEEPASLAEMDPQAAERPEQHISRAAEENGSDIGDAEAKPDHGKDSLDAPLRMRGRADAREPDANGAGPASAVGSAEDAAATPSTRGVDHVAIGVGEISLAETSGDEKLGQAAQKKPRRKKKDKILEPDDRGNTAQAPARKEARQKKGKAEAAANDAKDLMTCAICQASFESRTKLFAHIRASGHATLKG